MRNHSSSLAYAARLRILFKFLSQIFVVLAILSVVPLSVSLYFQEFNVALRYTIVIAGLLGIGVLGRFIPYPNRIQTNEATSVAALSFLLAPFILTIPMMASGLSFSDAIFEAISAATTTGLSTLSNIETYSKSFLFSRAWIQWVGGLGIVVLSLAVLVQPGFSARKLSFIHSNRDDIVGSTRAFSARLIKVYGLITIGGILLLWMVHGNLFESILYVFSAVSTGGFAPTSGSLADVSSLSRWVITGLCLLGAFPLIFYDEIIRGQPIRSERWVEIAALIILGIIFWSIMASSRTFQFAGSWWANFKDTFLLVFSAQTTAGFSTISVADLDPLSKGILCISMAIGGCVGSTAGGIKIIRVLVIIRIISTFFEKSALPPHASKRPRLQGKILSDEEIQNAFLVFSAFILFGFASWLPFLAAGFNPIDSLFEVVSALGTVGLSAGITHSELPNFFRGILCADMLLGRLEILPWLIILYPRTWVGRKVNEL